VELHNRPVPGQFVVTEEEALLFHRVMSLFADILTEVFDLEDPEVVKALEEKTIGRLILGYLKRTEDWIFTSRWNRTIT